MRGISSTLAGGSWRFCPTTSVVPSFARYNRAGRRFSVVSSFAAGKAMSFDVAIIDYRKARGFVELPPDRVL
jgi:hypothetical protein